MAKLRGSKKDELNAIAETLRLVLSSYTSKQDLIDGITSVIRTAEAWAANSEPMLSNDIKTLLHKTHVKRSLPAHCKDKQRGKDDECKYPVGSCELCRQ